MFGSHADADVEAHGLGESPDLRNPTRPGSSHRGPGSEANPFLRRRRLRGPGWRTSTSPRCMRPTRTAAR